MGDLTDPLIGYYSRERFYHSIQNVCDEIGGKKGFDGKLILWKCFGAGMEGDINLALRELENLREKRDYKLAAICALIFFHQSVKLRDREAISELEGSLSGAKTQASDVGLLLAANICTYIGMHSRARTFLDVVLQKNPMNVRACTLQGWAELLDLNMQDSNPMQHFEQALNADRGSVKDVDALMGKAMCLRVNGQFDQCMEVLDLAIVSHASFMPALVEKAKVAILMQRWEVAFEVAERVLHQDPRDICALEIVVLYQLAYEGHAQRTLESLQQLSDAIEQQEKNNTELILSIVKPVARLAGRNKDILRWSVRILEKLRRSNAERSDVLTEYAYQLLMMDKFDSAFSAYEQASQVDESNGEALFGQIWCMVRRGDLEEAAQQLEFLSVLQETLGRTAQTAFLEALLEWHHNHELKNALKLLNEAVHLHVKTVPAKPSSTASVFDQFTKFNPDFMLEIAKEYLQHSGSEPVDETETAPPHLLSGIKILEKVIQVAPGIITAQLLLAKAKFVKSDLDGATKSINRALQLDPHCSDVHLLMAQVALHQKDFSGAQSSIEMALAHNFEIKSNPTYLIVKSRVHVSKGDLDEARAILEEAIGTRSDVAEEETQSRRASSSRRKQANTTAVIDSCPLADQASIFLELVKIYSMLNQTEKALATMKIARKRFADTADDGRVIIAESELRIQQNDVPGALKLLNLIPPDSASFSKAHIAKANVLLTYRNDKDGFIRCYQDVVDHSKATNALPHMLLAEAYMRVNQADDAIEAFKAALKRNPKDAHLASKIGKVLMSTHDYPRAVEYYKSAIRGSDVGSSKSMLRYDLAELYFNLNRFDKAAKELQSSIQDNEADVESKSDSTSLGSRVKCLLLLAKVYEGANDIDKATTVLEQARDLQSEVLDQLKGMQKSEMVQQQKMEMAKLLMTLAIHHEKNLKSPDDAIKLYNDALRYHGSNTDVMLALARLYMKLGESDRCQNQCVSVLRIDENNEDAGMLLADLMFQGGELGVALTHYRQLVDKHPTNSVALGNFVGLMFRSGEIAEVEQVFQQAEHQFPSILTDAGFQYCRGLYYRYTNDLSQSVSCFNRARRDARWQTKALVQMIEIYLNPENSNLWDEDTSSDEPDAARAESLRTAKLLLEEYPDKESLEFKILEAYAAMATRSKSHVEEAFRNLVEMAQHDQEHVPTLLALSIALMMMKQASKARSQLKRVAKMAFRHEDANAFEKCWLILADIYIDSGKTEQAEELCKRCLEHNKSCAKAWEYMGMIMEKASAFQEAAENYERAWTLQNKSSAAVGFKLGFNYLKAKRYTSAIDVSYEVLKRFPTYPKIRKEILEKAQGLIRP